MLKTIAAISTALVFPFLAIPQGVTSGPSGLPTPKFEVASVKECGPDKPKGQIPPFRTFSGGISLGCSNLKTLMQLAYDVFADGKSDIQNPGNPSIPIEGLPNWVNSTSYSIEAKTESPQSAAMMRGPMMQALLEERFDMKVHREKREVPVYLMTVARGGVKMQETKEGTCTPLDYSEALNMKPADQPFCAFPSVIRKGPLMIMDARGLTLGPFAKRMRFDGRPIIDRTGLTGAFDIHLEWGSDVPDQPADSATGVARDPSSGASLIVALREQLGLQLNNGRGMSEFIVVDHIGQLREN
jgi:uncharacterized protein (TIGR03435 family)